MEALRYKSMISWYDKVIRERSDSSYSAKRIRSSRNKLADLRVDFAFKQLFGRPGHEHILIDFLNELLKLPTEKRICGVTLLNPEMIKEYEDDKKSVLDLHVETNDFTRINIEIQISNKYDMPQRTLYHWSRIYSSSFRLERAEREAADRGRTEGRADIIKAMLKQGVEVGTIARMTGVSREEIERIGS